MSRIFMSEEKVYAICNSFYSPKILRKVSVIPFPVFGASSKIFSVDVVLAVV